MGSMLLLFTSILSLQEPYAPFVAEASGEGQAAIAAMEYGDGFEVDLFAAEPMLANPVIFHVDHQGDVYVCESFRVNAGVTDMREHMDWLADELDNLTVEDRVDMYRRQEGDNFASYGTEHERIRLLRDTDGDGKADLSTVFADGFNDPADGIAAGVLSYRGEVFYTCIPHLWRLRDEDADGVSDTRESLSYGYGVHIALLGHDLHGLVIGPDGRLYYSIGDRGYHIEHEGRVHSLPHAGAVFRCELDGSDLEVFHTGLRNPQELVFDDYGDLFTGDNNSDGGDKARWVQIVEGADTGWRFYFQYVTEPVVRGPWNDEKLWHPWHAEQPAYLLPPIANLASGPSGLEYYPGTGLPEKYQRHFFLCDFRGDAGYSGVHTFTNKQRGAGFELGPVEPFLWKTLVTDVQFAPDGSFYFSDWVHGWGMTGKGRVYRLRHPQALANPLVRETRDLLLNGFDDLGDLRLGELLDHPDRRVRQEAHLELAFRGADAPLMRTAMAGDGLARIHAIWGLGIIARRGGDRELITSLLAFLEDADPEVRAQTARVLGDLRAPVAVDHLFSRLGDDSARVRHHAAIGLGRIGVPAATRGLFKLAADVGDSDPVLRHAVVMGLLGCATDAELLDRAGHDDRHVRMAALLTLRRRAHPGIARFLDDPDPLLVREAATAIHDVRIEAALPALASMLERPDVSTDAIVRRALNAAMWLGDDTDQAAALARYAARGDQARAHRAEALRILADWSDPSNIDRVLGRHVDLPPRDASGIPGVIADLGPKMLEAPKTVLEAWIETAGATGAAVDETLTGLLRDRERPASVRIAALRALERMAAPQLQVCVGEALSDGDGLVRAAGIAMLPRLMPEDAMVLLRQVLADGERAERRAAYDALGRLSHPDASTLLMAELNKLAVDLIPDELALDLVLAAEDRADPTLSAHLEARAADRSADPELAPWLDGLFGGDPKAGRRIFHQKAEVSCLRCHQTGKQEGPQVGPSLSGVGQRMTRLQLLESIAAPNRNIAADYDTETFFFLNGDALAGRVVEESAEAIVVVDANGDVWDVDLADIDERRPGLSAMPDNLVEHLSREQMRDLLEYLATL